MAVGLVASPRKAGRYVAGIAGFTAGGIGPGHGGVRRWRRREYGPQRSAHKDCVQYAGSGGVFDDNVPVTPGPQTVSASITGGISVVFTATVSFDS